ncbi:MAG TPA: hypothetical protein VMC06_02420 [Opitutaceae bacterium]|nr:hypothetical protein [Opitutaceae bacterium]
MNLNLYHFLHIAGLLILVGGTFYAFAAPAETRGRVLALTGVASLLMLASGFGLLAKMYAGHFYLWVIVKLFCWLGLSALTGFAYRRRERAGLLMMIAAVFALTAVAMVYFKPGM